MKKITVFAITFLFFTSCQQDESKQIIKGAEKYLTENLKDPSSFQSIKSEIIDTVKNSDYYKSLYTSDTIQVNKAILQKESAILDAGFEKGDEAIKTKFENIHDSAIAQYKLTADNRLKQLQSIKIDSIFYIDISINYRAKNGFGALDVFNRTVKYYPNSKTYEVGNDDK